MSQEMADMRERYAHLYRDHEALKLQLSSISGKMDDMLKAQQNQGIVDCTVTTQDRDKMLKMLDDADRRIKKGWIVIQELRRMLTPDPNRPHDRLVPRVYQNQATGEQIPMNANGEYTNE